VSVNRILVQAIAQVAVFLEFADDATVDPDAAVKQQEDLAFQLQQLPPVDRQQFIRMLSKVADDWPSEGERQYLLNLPDAIGIA
jgi:hypothetical protein